MTTERPVTQSRPRPFRVGGINHIGLAPKDPAKTRWFLSEVLGLTYLGAELVAAQETNTVMFDTLPEAAAAPPTGSRLEILEPQDGNRGPVARFLEKKGSGIHHVALAVDDVAAAIAHLRGLGVRMIDETPRDGAHATRIAFVHPESTGGLLIELVQEA